MQSASITERIKKKRKQFNLEDTDSSGGSSRISTQSMQRIVEKLKMQQFRSSTAETYFSVWRQFNKFLIQLDYMPAFWEDRAQLFMPYLIDQKGMQSCTVKSYVSAIKKILIINKYDWNDKRILVVSLTRACRLVNDSIRTWLPIHCSLLELILFETE